MPSYAICTTPRTGSTFLCRRLRNAGLGNPDEWLHATRPRPWATLAEWRQSRAKNGIFAIKLFWVHREDEAIVDFEDVLDEEPCWIYLRRKDVHSQALSYLTAVAREEWDEVRAPYLEFSPAMVSLWEAKLRRRNEDWRAWFRRKKIKPLQITYEDFIAAPDATVESIRSYLVATWPSG